MLGDKEIKMHNVSIKEFCDLIDECKGDVYLETADGDRLNLKSKLCQLVGLTKLIEAGEIAEATLVCSNKEDEGKLFRYNLFGHK